MATTAYNLTGFIQNGANPITVSPLTFYDDDPELSLAAPDFTELIIFNTQSYFILTGSILEVPFTTSSGDSYVENMLAWIVQDFSGSIETIFAPLSGSQIDTGSVITSGVFSVVERDPIPWRTIVPCFCAGTLIDTPHGQKPIEELLTGDLVATTEGDQTIRWIGRSPVDPKNLLTNPKLQPVRICAGAMGNGLPTRDLLVSQQHRMLINSKIAVRMFDVSEILVPAIKLTELPGIYVDEQVSNVEYFHLLFDEHHVIYAENAPSESLYLGPHAMNALGEDAKEEILTLFPQVAGMGYRPKHARVVPSHKHQRKLVERHLKNKKPLLPHTQVVNSLQSRLH